MQRWNLKMKKYELYEVPENWNVPIYTDDMNEIVNCARCGKLISFGLCYTSRQIHNHVGFGYAVCPRCNDRELEEECNE